MTGRDDILRARSRPATYSGKGRTMNGWDGPIGVTVVPTIFPMEAE